MLQRGPRGREVHSLLDPVSVTKVVSLGVGGSTGTERVRQRVRSLLVEDSLVKGRRGEECVKRDTVVADGYEGKLKMPRVHPLPFATDPALEKISTCPHLQRSQ